MRKFKNVGAGPVSAQKGITLIALIITIIVMLILVAVTITMAINGGLFEKAGEAVGDTKNEINKEQTLANGQITVDGKVYNSIDDFLAGNAQTPTYANAAKDNGYLTEKATYSDGVETNPAVIPVGYKVVNDGEKIANGIVIADSNDNEFVWIPVKKAIVTESEIAKIKEEDSTITTDLKAVQKMVNNGTYPMAVEVNTKDGEGNVTATNYKGILYDFSGTDTLTLTVKDWTNTSSYREPANLEESKTWTSPININGTIIPANTSGVYDSQNMFTLFGVGTYTDTLYQNAYNKMVQSVAQNGGFYVGRYEVSLYTDAEDSTKKYAQSKVNQTALVGTTWYEMYKYERDYSTYNTNLGVTSEMIWGSEWDQMMIFVNGKNDGATTPAKFYVTTTGSRQSGSSSTKTGMNTVDQVANIFDLEAGRYEKTQEAKSSSWRVSRGGYYDVVYYASGRTGDDPTSFGNPNNSSRVSLYIK